MNEYFRKIYKNPLRDPKKLHCSEAVTIFLQYMDLAKELDPESTTPEDLLQYCLNNKNIFKRKENVVSSK